MNKNYIDIAAAYFFVYAFTRITVFYTPGLSSLGQGLVVQWLMIWVIAIYYMYNRSESDGLWGVFDVERINVQQANICLIVTVLLWAAINILIPWRIGPDYDTTELIILGLLGAPIVEEVYFRQLILKELLPAGKWIALTVSTAAFSLLHMGQYSMLIALIMGFVLGYAYLQTRNILVPIAMHFTYNLLSILLNT